MNEPIAFVLCDDLIFTSRITGTARDLGFMAKTARAVEGLHALLDQEKPACLILDLSAPRLDLDDLFDRLRRLGGPRPKVVAYGSHVDTATLQRARAAGCDVVLPRSQFVVELPKSLPDWIGGPKPR